MAIRASVGPCGVDVVTPLSYILRELKSSNTPLFSSLISEIGTSSLITSSLKDKL